MTILLVNLQLTWSDNRLHIKLAVSLMIAYGHVKIWRSECWGETCETVSYKGWRWGTSSTEIHLIHFSFFFLFFFVCVCVFLVRVPGKEWGDLFQFQAQNLKWDRKQTAEYSSVRTIVTIHVMHTVRTDLMIEIFCWFCVRSSEKNTSFCITTFNVGLQEYQSTQQYIPMFSSCRVERRGGRMAQGGGKTDRKEAEIFTWGMLITTKGFVLLRQEDWTLPAHEVPFIQQMIKTVLLSLCKKPLSTR